METRAIFDGRYTVREDGKVWGKRFKTPLREGITKGYKSVRLSRKCKEYKYYVHRLVLLAFVGPLPEGMECGNHKDGDKLNNHISNLEYVTHSQNMKHAFALGLVKMPRGEHNSSAKLTERDVSLIRSYHAVGVRNKDIARMFGIAPPTACDIYKRRTWRHI